MINIDLPEKLELTCPGCEASFTISPKLLHQRSELHCPACSVQFHVYDGLTGQVRRQMYYAVRDAIEQRVYEQYQMNRHDYFEDWGNIVTGSSDTAPPEDPH
jgi:uncharacterized Zn-finger protein